MLNGFKHQVDAARRQLAEWGVSVEFGVGGLTFLSRDPEIVSQQNAWIEEMIRARKEARSRKDWKESDRIRDELAAKGILLKDSKDGTTWEIAP
jgi:cysteinyl-tRNA synthetase